MGSFWLLFQSLSFLQCSVCQYLNVEDLAFRLLILSTTWYPVENWWNLLLLSQRGHYSRQMSHPCSLKRSVALPCFCLGSWVHSIWRYFSWLHFSAFAMTYRYYLAEYYARRFYSGRTWSDPCWTIYRLPWTQFQIHRGRGSLYYESGYLQDGTFHESLLCRVDLLTSLDAAFQSSAGPESGLWRTCGQGITMLWFCSGDCTSAFS